MASDELVCKKCKTENPGYAKYCSNCGGELVKDTTVEITSIVCLKCDNLNPTNSKFCQKCGEKIVLNKEVKLKSSVVSLILAAKEKSDEAIGIVTSDVSDGEKREAIAASIAVFEKGIAFFKEAKRQIKDKAFLEQLDFQIKQFESEVEQAKITDARFANSFVCVHCKNEILLDKELKNEKIETQCNLCHKKFKAITGTILTIRGRTHAAVQFGAEPISITLKLDKGQTTVNFRTNYRFLVNKGDRVSFVFVKKFLSSAYNDKPSFIFNWTTEQPYII